METLGRERECREEGDGRKEKRERERGREREREGAKERKTDGHGGTGLESFDGRA